MGVCLRLDGFINDGEMLGKQRRINIKQCLKYVSMCFGQHIAGVPQVSYDMTLCLFACSLSLSLCVRYLIVLFIDTHLGSVHLVRLAVRAWRAASSCPDQKPHVRTHTTTSRRLDDKPASIAELNRTENIREPQVQRL